ncbi:MAG: peptidyl-prolyl cis-trans isomerase B (cyclophilin B) [Parcubacteria group bacterium Gr01-1014_29]|nr:MAG: peptidyl-prolyl cis-trans isomerase B (cyclophilin B) [Parcubacteria group bacterium Gr01-1014_29]
MQTFIKYIVVLGIITGAVFLLSRSTISLKEEGTRASEPSLTADIQTNFGMITVELFPEDAPKTVENFIKLAESKFYDGTKLHRIIKNFMIQGGDPNSKDTDWSDDGKGGPGYAFEDEFNEHKVVRGALAMANSGPNTNGSQFFVVTAKETPWLDGKHTVFGRVVRGMEIIDKIELMATNEKDHPLEDVVIENIAIPR